MTSPDRLRFDALTTTPVVVAESRQSRPNLPSGQCPFCPGGLEAPEDYDVRWFTNRWPPLPGGKAEVVLYTREHEGSLWSLGAEQVEKVIALWEERTTVLGARDDVAYVLIFENRGPQVGATIAHPHGQIYAFDEVPPKARVELDQQSCALCTEEPGERVVSEGSQWRAWVPSAASWPYELVIAPRSHLGDLAGARDDRSDLAAVLVDALQRLDKLFSSPMPYMMWIHQRPTDGDPWHAAHVHFHIAPLFRSENTQRFVAAGELGSGIFFNPVPPENAAAALRETLNEDQ